jgi:uncharacterized protein YdeI (BOF family)
MELLMKTLSLIVLLAALAGCGKPSGKVLGKAPAGDVKNIIAVHAGETPPVVTLSGTLVEKCPAAGCWFYLKDSTGMIRVDTKAAGFVVVEVPLQTTVTVSGRLSHAGDETVLEATGLRY